MVNCHSFLLQKFLSSTTSKKENKKSWTEVPSRFRPRTSPCLSLHVSHDQASDVSANAVFGIKMV